MPLKSKKFNHEALTKFIAQIGIPNQIHFNNAKSQVGKAWKRIF